MSPQAYLKPLEALARGFFFIQSLTLMPEEYGKHRNVRAIARRLLIDHHRRDRQSPRETSGVRISR